MTPFTKPNFKDANYRSGDNFVALKKKGMELVLPKKTKYNEDDRSNNANSIGKRSIEVDDVEVAEQPKNNLNASNDSQQRSTSVLEVFEFKRDSSVKELRKLQKNTPLATNISMFDQKKRQRGFGTPKPENLSRLKVRENA